MELRGFEESHEQSIHSELNKKILLERALGRVHTFANAALLVTKVCVLLSENFGGHDETHILLKGREPPDL